MSLSTLGANFADMYVNEPHSREIGAGAAPPVNTAQAISDALKSLTAYIPGEILTFYLGATAAIAAADPKALGQSSFTFWTFIICLLATPIWAYFAVFLAATSTPPLKAVLWPMFAGTIAFAAYAFAVPGGLLSQSAGAGALFATLAVLGVTPILHLGGLVYIRLVK